MIYATRYFGNLKEQVNFIQVIYPQQDELGLVATLKRPSFKDALNEVKNKCLTRKLEFPIRDL